MKLDKSYKVRVTPEQSREIQELLFALGGGWFGGHNGKHPAMLDADYLFLHDSMVLTYAHERGTNYFEDKPNHTEIQADGLIALLTDLSKSAENPLQNMKLTPEFDTKASEPKFKVGDKVYCLLLEPKIFTILGVESDNTAHFGEIGKYGYRWWRFKNLCHATQENYERLKATFPGIEFERPTKELAGSDLCFKKLRAGKEFIVCAVSDLSDEKAIKRLQDGDNCIRIIKDCDPAPYHFIDVHGIRHGFAVPLNDETGEPLTESVLDE